MMRIARIPRAAGQAPSARLAGQLGRLWPGTLLAAAATIRCAYPVYDAGLAENGGHGAPGGAGSGSLTRSDAGRTSSDAGGAGSSGFMGKAGQGTLGGAGAGSLTHGGAGGTSSDAGGAESTGTSSSQGGAGVGGVSGSAGANLPAGGNVNPQGGTAGTSGDAGAGGTHPPCPLGSEVCGPAGHERCTSAGWIREECPTGKPFCDGDGCNSRGPEVVWFDTPNGRYGIDATEVTRAQYALFLRSIANDTRNQDEHCQWNGTYEPMQSLDGPNLPVSGVDFCDAVAYCRWAGKHVCGRIGGGPLTHEQAFDADSGEWFRACAGTNYNTHPYGNGFDAKACNTGYYTDALAPVASFPQCVRNDVYDLSGNVAEWEDYCEPGDDPSGSEDECLKRGGGYFDFAGSASWHRCDTFSAELRSTQYDWLGIRCCAGPS